MGSRQANFLIVLLSASILGPFLVHFGLPWALCLLQVLLRPPWVPWALGGTLGLPDALLAPSRPSCLPGTSSASSSTSTILATSPRCLRREGAVLPDSEGPRGGAGAEGTGGGGRLRCPQGADGGDLGRLGDLSGRPPPDCEAEPRSVLVAQEAKYGCTRVPPTNGPYNELVYSNERKKTNYMDAEEMKKATSNMPGSK